MNEIVLIVNLVLFIRLENKRRDDKQTIMKLAGIVLYRSIRFRDTQLYHTNMIQHLAQVRF